METIVLIFFIVLMFFCMIGLSSKTVVNHDKIERDAKFYGWSEAKKQELISKAKEEADKDNVFYKISLAIVIAVVVIAILFSI